MTREVLLSERLAMAHAEALRMQEALRNGYVRDRTQRMWLLQCVDVIAENLDAARRMADAGRA